MATIDKTGFEKAGEDRTDNDDAEWLDRPEPGDYVQGILLDRVEEAGDYNKPLYRIRRTDLEDYDGEPGPVVLMWSNEVIDNRLQDDDVTPGDEILIEAVGTDDWETPDGETVEVTQFEVFYK